VAPTPAHYGRAAATARRAGAPAPSASDFILYRRDRELQATRRTTDDQALVHLVTLAL
jgi:hypothetical protein